MALIDASRNALAVAVRQARAAFGRAGVEPAQALRLVLRTVLERQIAALGLDVDAEAELPGFFSAATAEAHVALRAFEARELDAVWSDPTALGWAYQFWNDVDREAIDERIGPRGRVQLHEIACKTQLFTERYMVDWLVQNSIGRLVEGPPAAPYRVAPESGPTRSLEELRVLDPACGTGHFLVGAFDFLFEAWRHRDGVGFDAAAVAHTIVTRQLHGVDLDPMAVRVAAAALWLCVKRAAPHAVVPPLQLAALSLANGADDLRGTFEELGWRGTLFQTSSLSAELTDALRRHVEPVDLGVTTVPAALPAGARVLQLLREHTYDVVLSNPPYLASAKIELEPDRVTGAFDGLPDLFAAFTRRSLELCRPDGLVAFVAPSNWMFLSSFRPVRELLLRGRVVLLADLGKGAFQHASKLIQTAMVVASPQRAATLARGARLGSRDDIVAEQTELLAASLREPEAFTVFDPRDFEHVDGAPFLFWFDADFLRRYAELPKIGDVARGAGGIATSNNERFVRSLWEVPPPVARAALAGRSSTHVPYLKGADGREWIEPCRSLLRRTDELKLARPGLRVDLPTELGVAYTTIGQRFAARMHTTPSVRDVSGASFFPVQCTTAELLCALNRKPVRDLACALNPTINFQLGDIRRLPFDRDPEADRIVATLQAEFTRAERANELSLAYSGPDVDHAWPEAQRWAQRQIDRPHGAPLEPFTSPRRAADAHARLSHAVGVAFGRFGSSGLLDEPPAGTLDAFVADDVGLSHPALASLRAVWASLPLPFEGHRELDGWLRQAFFTAHRRRYDNRPIYLPLSSRRRNVVVWIAAHRFHEGLLARICEELETRAPASNADRIELRELVTSLRALDQRGPPAADGPDREADAPFELGLEDGILVHVAALWPVLEPQWKDARRFWRDLSRASGKRDYDWSRLAARYFPARVHAKCTQDPSLALAHRPTESAPRVRTPLAPSAHPRILEP